MPGRSSGFGSRLAPALAGASAASKTSAISTRFAANATRSLTLGARIGAPTVREGFPEIERGLMEKSDILRVWSRVLRGYRPFLSLEITKECPLHCPGCYAYSPEHLGPLITMRQMSDYRGDELVNATIAVVRRLRPVHISIVGGEPLVRYRELGELLPRLDRMGVEVQLVTSAVRPIPQEWKAIRCLHL